MSQSQSNQGENILSVTPSGSSPTPNSIAATNPCSEPSIQTTQGSPNKRKLGKLYSKVWEEFERVVDNGHSVAICHHCKTKLKANSKNGTTHLKNHLERCTKRRNVDIRDQLQISAKKGADGKVQFGNFTFDQSVSRMELASAIILHEYPLSMVDHVGFRKFVSSLQPLFKMVSRNTIKNDILKLYQEEKLKAYMMFDKLPSRVAITTDMWSSRQKRGYMAITAHFVDPSWCLRSMIIGFTYVPAPHNKDILCDVLMDCLLDWNLDRKVSTITVDNCTTNDALLGSLLDKFIIRDSLILGGKLLHMRCAAHILNLVVKDGLHVIGSAIEKIRDSVVFWTATQGREEKFEEAAKQLKIPCTKKLSLDCKTRWNSTYLMLETAIIYKDVFPRLRQRERHYISLPSEEEWSVAKDICGRLKLFFQVTETFSKTNFSTANCLFPKICEIKLALRSWSFSDNEVIRKMALDMLEKFDKYWSECHLVAGIAIVLDPRYKMTFLEHVLQKIYGGDATYQIEKVRGACYDLLNEYQVKLKVGSNEPSESCPSGVTSLGGSTSESLGGEWDVDIFSEYDQIVHGMSGHVNIKSELDHYLEEKIFPRTQDFDILNWWKANGVRYPTLQLIARDILAIPVSTVTSESAFSTSGRMVSPHRSRLSAVTLEALMLTEDWLWNKLEGDASTVDSRPTVCDEENEA